MFSSLIRTFLQLLEVDEAARLGSDSPTSIKSHSWFNDIDWKLITDGTFPVPNEVITRINLYIENHAEADTFPESPHDLADLNTPEWLEGW